MKTSLASELAGGIAQCHLVFPQLCYQRSSASIRGPDKWPLMNADER